LQDKAGQSFRENCTKLQFCRKSEIARTASVYAPQEAILARSKTQPTGFEPVTYRLRIDGILEFFAQVRLRA
jgi:hypothetical protein